MSMVQLTAMPEDQPLGKWLIFKHISCIDQFWETISQTLVSGEFGATAAKVSTKKVNPKSLK